MLPYTFVSSAILHERIICFCAISRCWCVFSAILQRIICFFSAISQQTISVSSATFQIGLFPLVFHNSYLFPVLSHNHLFCWLSCSSHLFLLVSHNKESFVPFAILQQSVACFAIAQQSFVYGAICILILHLLCFQTEMYMGRVILTMSWKWHLQRYCLVTSWPSNVYNAHYRHNPSIR